MFIRGIVPKVQYNQSKDLHAWKFIYVNIYTEKCFTLLRHEKHVVTKRYNSKQLLFWFSKGVSAVHLSF